MNPTVESGLKRKNGPWRLLQKELGGQSMSHDEVSVRLMKVTLTRHCEQPFGVAAEAVG
jgi:hypothetical protein